MALSLPPPALDTCLRGVYRAYVSHARFVTASSLPHIHFMGAGVVELMGLDLSAGWVALRGCADALVVCGFCFAC